MKSISGKSIIIWDFDGVLIDSMSIREFGFKKVLSEFPQDQIQRLLEFHQENGGLSRYVKFTFFFENIRGEKLEEEKLRDLTKRYSAIMRTSLIDKAYLIPDSNEYLKKHWKTKKMHLVSGSDENELRYLCTELNLTKYFQSIKGSPIPKKELVKNLLDENNYLLGEVCLIGDSVNDLEASETNGLDFFGYNNINLIPEGAGYIFSFKDLCD